MASLNEISNKLDSLEIKMLYEFKILTERVELSKKEKRAKNAIITINLGQAIAFCYVLFKIWGTF